MPIPTRLSRELRQRLDRYLYVFVNTKDDEEIERSVEEIVCDFAREKNAHIHRGMKNVRNVLSDSLLRSDEEFVIIIPRWEMFECNDIMGAFGHVFQHELDKYGPDSWCEKEEDRHKSVTVLYLENGVIEVEKPYENLSIVFYGTPEPIRKDGGIRHRFYGYKMMSM